MQEPTADQREGEEVFSPEELCVFAKISLATLQRYRRAGQGPPELQVGAAVRFLRSDSIGWLRSLRVRAQDDGSRDP
jgi:hypothetical protein